MAGATVVLPQVAQIRGLPAVLRPHQMLSWGLEDGSWTTPSLSWTPESDSRSHSMHSCLVALLPEDWVIHVVLLCVSVRGENFLERLLGWTPV